MTHLASVVMTAEDFYAFANQPENCERRFDLDNGNVVELPLPSATQLAVSANIDAVLGRYRDKLGQGVIFHDVTLCTRRDPDTVWRADFAFHVGTDSLNPVGMSTIRWQRAVAGRILCGPHSAGKTLRFVCQLLQVGLPMVWLLDVEEASVIVFTKRGDLVVLDAPDQLNGYDVLPGFRCTVSEFFAGITNTGI
jgi:Uma2 family endonuclease